MIAKKLLTRERAAFAAHSVRAIIIFITLQLSAFSVHAVTDSYSLSGTWIAPVGVTSVTVEAWGGGGAGGGASSNPSKGGGGAGGQYAQKAVTVTPGNSYAVSVGLGGTGTSGDGNAGGNSTFAATVVVAKGGAGGSGAVSGNGAAGVGSATGGVGTIIYAGGSGSNGTGSSGVGGAGGGGAGSGGAGGNASGNTAGAGTAAGGGDGAAGLTSRATGNAGLVLGGGGGGGYDTGSSRNGGPGADGMVSISYIAPPLVTTNVATAVTGSGVTLNGTVSSNGATTTVTFDYGTTTGYGSSATASTSPLAANATNAAVSAVVTGLACGTTYNFRVLGANSAGTTNGSNLTFTTLVCPVVTLINTNSVNPTAANTVVSWTVVFNVSVTGVDPTDFALLSAGGVTGATITSVSGSGTSYTVTVNTGTGTTGALGLRLADDDTIVDATGTPLGGVGTGNGNFTGQSYSVGAAICTTGQLFCDDFERSVVVGGSNTAGAVGTAPGYGAWTVSPLAGACAGVAGDAGCAGIDSDIPPFSTPSSPRANPTRSLFTRWSQVTVTSPVINLAGKTGVRLSFWVRRGSDCFSEWPGNSGAGCNVNPGTYTPVAGEEFQVQYKNNLGNWLVLAQFATDDTPGEILMPVIDLPDDAMYAGFQFRFLQPGGSGSGSTTGGAPGVRGYDYWHVDNVVMTEIPGVEITGPFCDTFEGDLSRWSMLGTGDVRIGTTWRENGLQDMDLRWNTVSATTRTVDLSNGSGNNIISFWVKRGTGTYTSLPNGTGSEYPETAAKGLKFEYRNSSGNWIQLGSTFPGGGTEGQVFLPTAVGTNNFAIPADAKHNKFKLRISLLSGAGLLDQDYWHVDDVCVGASLASTDLVMSMTSTGTFSPYQQVTYNLTVTNNGPSADPGPITIRDTLPVGLTYLSYSAGGWLCSVAGQTLTCTQSSGLAVGASTALAITASVDGTASGTVTNTATVGGQTIDTAQANNTASKTDTIFIPAYVFTNKACALDGTPIGSGAQCSEISWSPQISGTPKSNVYITAINSFLVPVQQSGSSPTTVNLQFGLTCVNPVSNAGVQATFYDGSVTQTLPVCQANGAIPSSWSAARGMVFPAATASVGPYNFNYNDVGSVDLYVRNSVSTTLRGHSGIFVVKPAGFVLSGIKCTTANSANCGAGALAMSPSGDNPAAATAAGVSFIRAGHPFTMTVKAVNSLGNATPNYGKEVVPNGIKLTPNNVIAGMVPAPAINGSFGTFASGAASGSAFSWDEVGIITLTPSVSGGDYLGVGDVTGTVSANVGRFFPEHFNTVVSAVSGVPMGCSGMPACPAVYPGFVYSSQSFSLTVTAKNASDVTTANYNTTTGFARSTSLTAWGVLGTTTAPTGAGALGATSVNATSFAAGSYTETAQKYTFSVSPTAPSSIYIRASDTEATSLRATNPTTTSVEGGVAIVSGRVKISNAHGSELLSLPMVASVQYYNGSNWLASNNDSVTSLTLNLANYQRKTGAAWTTTATPAGGVLTAPGLLSFNLSKPSGGGGTGSVDVNISGPGYLMSGSNGAAVNPSNTARATFGVYKGANEFIYMRENY